MTPKLTAIKSLIEEISMGPFGSDIKVENFIDSGVPVLNGSNLSGVKLNEDDFKYVSEEKAISLKKANARAGDIVITHRGTLGQISYIPNDSRFDKYVISQSQFRVRFDSNKVDPVFITYYFHTNEGQKRLLANKSYVGVPALAQATTNFRRIEIPLPNLTSQQKIAKVLSALDAKIELNNRINAELEATAKLLYDYWFVQFDFPCLPSGYKPLGAGKPACAPGNKPLGAGEPASPDRIAAVCNYRAVGGLPIPQEGKFFIYVLLCSDDSFYIGMTDDLYRRWYEHKTGNGAKWTKTHMPVKVIHHEVFASRSAAAEREKELKTGFGRKWLKREYSKLGCPNKRGGSPAHQSKLMQAGKMVFNPILKREIPEGWTVDTLDKLGEIIGGSTPSKQNDSYFSKEGIPWITPKDLSDNKGKKFIHRGEWDVTEAGKKATSLKVMPRGTVLLSSRAPIGYTAIASNPLTTNQGFKSMVPNRGYDTDYVYRTLNHFMPLIEQNASGSTFKEISGGTLKSIKIPFPTPTLEKQYAGKVALMSAQQENLEKQTKELTTLRDWLLPMLMNGQVTVKNDHHD
jgi:restriction endonuclease S subunit/predicted GIY-YIG superfamily endonuclease